MTLFKFIDSRGQLIALGGALLALLFAAAAYRGVTARKERREAARQLSLAATVFQHAREAIVVTDADATIIDVNPAFSIISGYDRTEVLGRNPRILQSGQHPAEFYAAFWSSLTQTGGWQGQFWNRRRDGELFATETTVSAVKDAAGQTVYYIGLFSNVTVRKRYQERIEHLALYDPLTELPNRALAMDYLRKYVAAARRNATLVAVCYLDLDDFKPVNDQHGHEAGDRLLAELAKRLLGVVREHDTVARLGGDEFLVLLTHLTDPAPLGPVLERLIEAVSAPVSLPQGPVVRVTTSIGVALFPDAAEEPEALLRQADQAMYQAKTLGRNQVQICSPQMRTTVAPAVTPCAPSVPRRRVRAGPR